jgi:hypothetical protein
MHSLNTEAYNFLNNLNSNNLQYPKENDKKSRSSDMTKFEKNVTSKSVINFQSNPSLTIPRQIMTSNSSYKPVPNKTDNQPKFSMLDKRFKYKRDTQTVNEKLSNKYKSFLTQNIPKLLEKYSV